RRRGTRLRRRRRGRRGDDGLRRRRWRLAHGRGRRGRRGAGSGRRGRRRRGNHRRGLGRRRWRLGHDARRRGGRGRRLGRDRRRARGLGRRGLDWRALRALRFDFGFDGGKLGFPVVLGALLGGGLRGRRDGLPFHHFEAGLGRRRGGFRRFLGRGRVLEGRFLGDLAGEALDGFLEGVE